MLLEEMQVVRTAATRDQRSRTERQMLEPHRGQIQHPIVGPCQEEMQRALRFLNQEVLRQTDLQVQQAQERGLQ